MRRPLLAVLVWLAFPPGPLVAQFPTEPPPPGPLTPLALPPTREVLLPNGLRLVVLEQPRQPVLSFSLAIPAGSAFDPAGKEGLADLYGRLLTRGAGPRSGSEMAAELERIGGSLGAVTDPDVLTIQADVMSSEAAIAFALLGDVVLRPALDTAELTLARTQSRDALDAEQRDPGQIATRVFLIGTYRQHPYGRRPTPRSIEGLTRADLLAFKAARVRPAGSVLVLAGDITLAQAQRLALQYLGAWKGTRPAGLAAVPPTPAPKAILLIHLGGAQEASIILGNTTFAGTDTSYYAAAVLSRILGEGRGSRLPRVLGDARGWTLATAASFQRTARLGLFQATATVPAAVADSALREMLSQLGQLRTDLVPARELERARDGVSGEFPLRMQTVGQLAAAVTQARMFGVPQSYITGYRTRIQAVTAAQLRGVARRVFDTAQTVVVVAGDASRLYQPLSALGPTRIFATTGQALTPADVEPKPGALSLAMGSIPLRTDSLVIVAQGQALGMQVTSLGRSGDSLVYTERTAVGSQLNQTTRVVLDTLGRMRLLDQSGKVRGQDTRIQLAYGNGRVKGQALVVTPDGPRSFAVDTAVSPAIVDDNALQALLPALPWALNTRWTIPVFGSGENRIRQVTLTVADIQPVTVPAGTFEAYRADLEGASQPVSFYVTTAAPHRVVKITLTGSPVEFLAVNP